MPFERKLAASPDPVALGTRYGMRAVPVMRLQSLLTANVRDFRAIGVRYANPFETLPH